MYSRYNVSIRFSIRYLFILLNFLAVLLLILCPLFSHESQLNNAAHRFFLSQENFIKNSILYTEPTTFDNFPNLLTKFNVPRRNSSHISRKLSKNDYDTFIRLLNLSIGVLDENEIAYTISAGGLIGSYVGLGQRLARTDIRLTRSHFQPKIL